jgi:hypothetical protein
VDQPEKKVYHNLTLAEAKVLERLVDEIKALIAQRGKVFRRPYRGRPRAHEPIQAFPITKPSSIHKRKRLKFNRKEFAQQRIERYKNLVTEDKQLLFRKLRNVRLANRRLVRNVRNITLFFQSLPDEVEEFLLTHPVLPSKLFDKPLTANIDKAYFSKRLMES